jgi:hypothetical protein
MKVSKNALKAVVKECLLEILAEGLRSQDVRKKVAPPRLSSTPPITHRPQQEARSKSNLLDKAVSEVVTESKIPALDEILSDTAKTSFIEQVAATAPLEKNKLILEAVSGNNTQTEDIGVPIDLFDNSSSWADIAFSVPANKQ